MKKISVLFLTVFISGYAAAGPICDKAGQQAEAQIEKLQLGVPDAGQALCANAKMFKIALTAHRKCLSDPTMAEQAEALKREIQHLETHYDQSLNGARNLGVSCD